ncbi:MAG TPA: acyl carrier protein [Streptosporangiaceae bacterium]|jgi:hypothetical protein
MHADLEAVLRRNLAQVLDPGVAPGDLDPDRDMVDEYGLTSINKVLFLTSACTDTGISLSNFTEHDLARMRTLRDVTDVLARHAGAEVSPAGGEVHRAGPEAVR